MRSFSLGPAAHATGYSLFGFESVDSTNKRALEFAKAENVDRVWFASLEQTAGRGRRGRAWSSNSGNLAASILVRADKNLADVGNLGFVAGVAVHQAISHFLPTQTEKLKLKWPNDVLFDGQKLVGILIEAQPGVDETTWLSAGIGVNVKVSPEQVPYPVGNLNSLGVEADAIELFAELSDCFAKWFDVWQWGANTEAVLDYWRAHALGQGRAVNVRQPQENFEGVFERLDDEGRLVVRLKDNSFRIVSAADVFFPSSKEPNDEKSN